MTPEELGVKIAMATGCGYGDTDAGGNRRTILCCDPKLKENAWDARRYHNEKCDCLTAARVAIEELRAASAC